MVEAGTFRLDLYYRLNVVPVKIPPLRERPEDLIELIFLLLNRINKKYNMNKVLSAAMIDQLLAYNWPGNVRELENVLERVAITVDGNVIYPESLADILPSKPTVQNMCTTETKEDFVKSLIRNEHLNLDEMLLSVESEILVHFMKELGSSRKVAKRLGVSQSTISRKLQKYDSN